MLPRKGCGLGHPLADSPKPDALRPPRLRRPGRHHGGDPGRRTARVAPGDIAAASPAPKTVPVTVELVAPGARAVILPEHGGRLHQLFVEVDGVEAPLLASPANPASYLVDPMRGGSFPMAPWPNRVKDSVFTFGGVRVELPPDGQPHALHGRVHNVPWTVTLQTGVAVEMTCDFDQGWPWAGQAWQRFELTPQSLVMKLKVRSETTPFPAGCGWHPWFRRSVAGSEDAAVTLTAGFRYVLDGGIPTGERVAPDGDCDLSRGAPLGGRRLDDCYGRVSGPTLIDWGRLALRVSNECSNPHVQVYTEPGAFCIEAQTCATDTFNLHEAEITGTGFAIASPGRPVAITSRWTWYRRVLGSEF
ncbi:MAG: hypothetical protein C0506_04255 [Anaerolinea sp.]|nr:hypothetical protein [Anaerolinea sp.]